VTVREPTPPPLRHHPASSPAPPPMLHPTRRPGPDGPCLVETVGPPGHSAETTSASPIGSPRTGINLLWSPCPARSPIHPLWATRVLCPGGPSGVHECLDELVHFLDRPSCASHARGPGGTRLASQ
jgi:hypothetical protein